MKTESTTNNSKPHNSNFQTIPNINDESKPQSQESSWTKDARIYEYGRAANPTLKPIPVLLHPASLHETGPTRIIPFDISDFLDIDFCACTSPNLLASFVRIGVGDAIDTRANATSQAFYVIRGSGTTVSEEHGTIQWNKGDVFVVPITQKSMVHTCSATTAHGAAALYWIHDAPLLSYLGVKPDPDNRKFEPTLHKHEELIQHVEEIKHSSKGHSTNRLGVLLGNARCEQTKTLTHVLWSLLNSIPAQTVQRPHRHNSVALDLAVSVQPGAMVYTLMGKEIDSMGFIVDPIRCDWEEGSVFVTPPGWWHSHHNESDSVAWVLPMQDAGLYTHQRTLDIRFVDDELELYRRGRIRGSAFAITNEQYVKMSGLGPVVPPDSADIRRNMSADCLTNLGDVQDRSPSKSKWEAPKHTSRRERDFQEEKKCCAFDDDDAILDVDMKGNDEISKAELENTAPTTRRRKCIQVGKDL